MSASGQPDDGKPAPGAPTQDDDDLAPPTPVAADKARLPTVAFETYAIEGEVARGGLGRILRARDTRLGRTVALKEIILRTQQGESRFVREALVTARLEHPAIVPVHEAGRWPTGEPFYAMKMVSGQTLEKLIRRAGSLAERLALLPSVIAVAEAVAYAHSKGVIHRDLKPSNVLVGQFGETVLVNWGLAKDLRAEEASEPEAPTQIRHLDDETGGTIAGAVLGTPCYMPPEQARGESVDERADVYALGAILYELLCGREPYAAAGKGHSGSRSVLDEVIRAPAAPVDSLQEGIPNDLLAVVRKAMARLPGERYPTAKELAADLKLFQTGQLVSAREYSAWALARRWLLRYRLPVGVALGALALLATLGALDVRRIVDARAAAEAARAQAEARSNALVLLQARALLDRDPTTSLAWLKQIPAHAPLWDEARAVAVEAVSRGYARDVWRYGDYTAADLSPDGRLLVLAGADARLRVIDLAGGGSRLLPVNGTRAIETSFAADGQIAAIDDDGTVYAWPPGGLLGAEHAARVLGHVSPGGFSVVAFSPDGRLVAAASDQDPAVVVWDSASGASRTLAGGSRGAREIVFSPDSKLLAVSLIDKTVRVWDLAGGGQTDLQGTDVVSRLVFTPDSARLLVAQLDGIYEWTLATRESRLLPFPKQRYIAVAVSPAAGTIAAAGFEGPVHLLDGESGEITTLYGHVGTVTDLVFSPDGRTLVSTARDHSTRLWQLPEHRDRILGRLDGQLGIPAFAPDGSAVAAGGSDGNVYIWPLAGGAPRVLAGHQKAVFDVAFSPDGATLASQSKDQTVRLWDVASGTGQVVAQTAAWVDYGRLRFSPDGRYLACTLDLETLAVLEARSGRQVCLFGGRGYNLAHAFSLDSARIAFTGNEELLLADVATCESRRLDRHAIGKSSYEISFSRDGRVASGSDDGTILLYTPASGRSGVLGWHGTDVFSVAFSPDGRTLASGSSDHTVRLWDVESATSRLLRGHELLVAGVRFSPDGRTLASYGPDRTIRLWDVATGAGSVLRGHRDKIVGIAFSPVDKWLVSASLDGTVRLWPADAKQDVPVEALGIKDWLERITTARIGADNQVSSLTP